MRMGRTWPDSRSRRRPKLSLDRRRRLGRLGLGPGRLERVRICIAASSQDYCIKLESVRVGRAMRFAACEPLRMADPELGESAPCAAQSARGRAAVLAPGRPLAPRVEFATCAWGMSLLS